MTDRPRRSRWLLLAVCIALPACATRPSMLHGAYEQALWFGDAPRRGVVLFLHGCRGLDGSQLSPWQSAWVQHLTGSGFVVVAPDSFADPRPGQSCRTPYRNKEEIYEIRAGQAVDAIERIRSTYPGSKLLVWGHSEGGGVANLITAKVSGIITTGYQCGFRSTGRTSVPPDVPLLAIQGTADAYIAEALRWARVSSAESLCRTALSSAEQRAVIVRGMPHEASLDWLQVREALDQFLEKVAAAP